MDTTINDNASEDARMLNISKDKVREYSDAFKKDSITSLDIILPPFLDLKDEERRQFNRQ